eukprot:SAG31_NODE_23928_length_492_cov_1.763359_2_plen_105_part_01
MCAYLQLRVETPLHANGQHEKYINQNTCLCLDPVSSFQSLMPHLWLDHDRDSDLDACGTHHLSNDRLSASQQDHSDFMKSPGFYLGSAHMSDVFVSNMSARLSFG